MTPSRAEVAVAATRWRRPPSDNRASAPRAPVHAKTGEDSVAIFVQDTVPCKSLCLILILVLVFVPSSRPLGEDGFRARPERIARLSSSLESF